VADAQKNTQSSPEEWPQVKRPDHFLPAAAAGSSSDSPSPFSLPQLPERLLKSFFNIGY